MKFNRVQSFAVISGVFGIGLCLIFLLRIEQDRVSSIRRHEGRTDSAEIKLEDSGDKPAQPSSRLLKERERMGSILVELQRSKEVDWDSRIAEEPLVLAFKEILDKGDAITLQALVKELQAIRAPGMMSNSKLERAAAKAIALHYFETSDLPLAEILESSQYSGPSLGLLIGEISSSLVTLEHPDKAFRDLLEVYPTRSVNPMHYMHIASETAHIIGHENALDLIPNKRDGWFGASATSMIVSSWVSSDPVAASTYIRDLRDTGLRGALAYHMIKQLAEEGDFEMAYEWAEFQEGEMKEKSIKHIEHQAAVKREQQNE